MPPAKLLWPRPSFISAKMNKFPFNDPSRSVNAGR